MRNAEVVATPFMATTFDLFYSLPDEEKHHIRHAIPSTKPWCICFAFYNVTNNQQHTHTTLAAPCGKTGFLPAPRFWRPGPNEESARLFLLANARGIGRKEIQTKGLYQSQIARVCHDVRPVSSRCAWQQLLVVSFWGRHRSTFHHCRVSNHSPCKLKIFLYSLYYR